MAGARLSDLDYSVLQQCMHCGMCLPSCPTYVSTRLERHSPRGRIALMRAVADGQIEFGEELTNEMNYCLGCLACTSACPAGVDYTTMFETARAQGEGEPAPGGPMRRFYRWLALEQIFLHPVRLRFLGWLLRWYQQTHLDRLVRALRLPYLLGRGMGEAEKQTPRFESRFSDAQIAEVEVPTSGIAIRGRVGLLSGCVQSLAFASVNRATADVLLANGWEVVTPRLQGCCGSLHAHNGAPALAKRAAEALMEQFDFDNLDAVISNAGGCGSHLKRYHHLFDRETEPALRSRAERWDAKLKDIHEFLAETGWRSPEAAPSVETVQVTYHESCHLCHGQGVRRAPREILRSIPGLELRELPNSDHCCGSAGIYSLTQPAESQRILARKLEDLATTGASRVVTSNPGCHLQIQAGLESQGSAMDVSQPIVLLAAAYRSEAVPR